MLMPRMSLAGSKPMGSSMRFTEKNMEFPAGTLQVSSFFHCKSCPAVMQAPSRRPESLTAPRLVAAKHFLYRSSLLAGSGLILRRKMQGFAQDLRLRKGVCTVGQRAQDAQELQAGILFGEVLQDLVTRRYIVAPLLPWTSHQHLHMTQTPHQTCASGTSVGPAISSVFNNFLEQPSVASLCRTQPSGRTCVVCSEKICLLARTHKGPLQSFTIMVPHWEVLDIPARTNLGSAPVCG